MNWHLNFIISGFLQIRLHTLKRYPLDGAPLVAAWFIRKIVQCMCYVLLPNNSIAAVHDYQATS